MDQLLDRMYTFGADAKTLKKAYSLMDTGKPNTGFTFTNPEEHLAIVAVGPVTSGREFQNTLVHEVHHLAVAIVSGLGINLDSEEPAYISGDSMLALAEVVCSLGCDRCNCDSEGDKAKV